MILKPAAGFNVRKVSKRDRVWYARGQQVENDTFLLTGGPVEDPATFMGKPGITRRDVIIRLDPHPTLAATLVARWQATVTRWETIEAPAPTQILLDYGAWVFDNVEQESSQPYLYLPRLRGRGYIGLIWSDINDRNPGFFVENGNVGYNGDMQMSAAAARVIFGQLLTHPVVQEEYFVAKAGDVYTLTAKVPGQREPLLMARTGVNPALLTTGDGDPGLGRLSWFATLQITDAADMDIFFLVLVRPNGTEVGFRLGSGFTPDQVFRGRMTYFVETSNYTEDDTDAVGAAARDWAKVLLKLPGILAKEAGDSVHIIDQTGEGFRDAYFEAAWTTGMRWPLFNAAAFNGSLTLNWGGQEGAQYAV